MTLNNVVGIEVEVEFSQLYENQPLFNDVDNFLRDKGFELFDLRRGYWIRKVAAGIQKGQLVFADALYLKSPEQIMLVNVISPVKIIHSICIYLSYGYIDLVTVLLSYANNGGLLTNELYRATNKIILQCNKIALLPNFRGRARIKNIFDKLSSIFINSDGCF